MQERTPDEDRARTGDARDDERARAEQEQRLDEQIEDSFPASDPPSTTPVQGVGSPPDEPRGELEDDTHEG